MSYITLAYCDKCYSRTVDKGHGEYGGRYVLICMGEQERERCLEELMLELRPERVYGYAREREVKNGFCCQQQSLPWLFSPSVLVRLILCLFFRTFWYVYVLYQPSKQNPKHALLSCSYYFHMLCCSPGKPSSLLNSLIFTLPIRWSVLSTFHDFYSS